VRLAKAEHTTPVLCFKAWDLLCRTDKAKHCSKGLDHQVKAFASFWLVFR